MKNRKERDPLGFWEISKKLWRENWSYYLLLAVLSAVFSGAIVIGTICLYRLG